METNAVRIFVSSPSDVEAERKLSEEILHLLRLRFSGILHIETFYWEHEPLAADTDPQSQTELPENFDIVICILWSRLGMRLHPTRHTRPDGSVYDSGTQFELENALAGYERGRSRRCTSSSGRDEPLTSLLPEKREEPLKQWDALAKFYDKLMQEDGRLISSENPYVGGLAEFEHVFEERMSKLLTSYVPKGYKRFRSAIAWPHESSHRRGSSNLILSMRSFLPAAQRPLKRCSISSGVGLLARKRRSC